jgi:hypothetical protein
VKALADQQRVQTQLIQRALHHLLLHRALMQQAKDDDLLLLADAMRPIHRLLVD